MDRHRPHPLLIVKVNGRCDKDDDDDDDDVDDDNDDDVDNCYSNDWSNSVPEQPNIRAVTGYANDWWLLPRAVCSHTFSALRHITELNSITWLVRDGSIAQYQFTYATTFTATCCTFSLQLQNLAWYNGMTYVTIPCCLWEKIAPKFTNQADLLL